MTERLQCALTKAERSYRFTKIPGELFRVNKWEKKGGLLIYRYRLKYSTLVPASDAKQPLIIDNVSFEI